MRLVFDATVLCFWYNERNITKHIFAIYGTVLYQTYKDILELFITYTCDSSAADMYS